MYSITRPLDVSDVSFGSAAEGVVEAHRRSTSVVGRAPTWQREKRIPRSIGIFAPRDLLIEAQGLAVLVLSCAVSVWQRRDDVIRTSSLAAEDKDSD